METTNSFSSGRNTRYSPPAEEVMLNPSRRPIRSSWSIDPRLVKNCLPACRQMLCRRPLVSVSRTHSPASSGPRCTPDHDCARFSAGGAEGSWGDIPGLSHEPVAHTAKAWASLDAGGERLVDVVGDQHAEDAAVPVEQEVLRRGCVLHREDQRLAGPFRGGRQTRLERTRGGATRAPTG